MVGGCASVFNSSESEVQLRTNPASAHCQLSGQDGYSASVETPAAVMVPHAAAPVTVACVAGGYRRTVNSLNTTPSGWMWANSALLVATGGAVALGLVVDQSLGTDRTYRPEMNVDLDPERTRSIHARSRDGHQDLELKTR